MKTTCPSRFALIVWLLVLAAVQPRAFAQTITATGNVSPFPDPNPLTSSWNVGGNLTAGSSAAGSVAVDGGLTVTTNDTILGANYGRLGAITVSGNGSEWTASGTFYVGQYGNGTLSVTSGGLVTSGTAYLAFQGGGNGSATIDASTWNPTNLYVGNRDVGQLTIQNGSSVSTAALYLGRLRESGDIGAGTLMIDNSSLTATNTTYIGYSGNGTATAKGGSTVSTGGLSLGSSTSGVGTLTLQDTGTTWTDTFSVSIGGTHQGTLNVRDGAKLTQTHANDLNLGVLSGATGTVSINNATLETTSARVVVGVSGTGTLSVESGGTLTVGGTHTVAVASASGSTGTLNFGKADFTTTAGTTNATSIAFGSGTGRVNFNQTDTLTLAAAISGGGTVYQQGSGTTILTGTNTYTGATSVTAGELNLTGSAANSAFTLSGGTLSGSGTLGALTINSGGTVSPGNSPGTLNAGNTTFAGGGSFQFEINDANGSAGSAYDLLAISGSLTISATSGSPFGIDVTSLTLANTAGLTANFDSAADYSFTFLTTTGGITGFSADKFAISTTNFTNPFSGTWSVAQTNGGNDLALNYTGASAIPEPSTYAAIFGGAALGLAAWRRRRA